MAQASEPPPRRPPARLPKRSRPPSRAWGPRSTTSREVGGAIGIAVIGSILASTYSSQVNLAGLPAQLAAKVKASYAIASQLGAGVAGRAQPAFVSGMHLALLAAAGAALLAALGAALLGGRRSRRADRNLGASKSLAPAR